MAANQAGIGVVNKLLNTNKNHDRLFLHSAVANKAELDVLSSLLQAYKGAAKVPDKNKDLPLHLAANQAWIGVVNKRSIPIRIMVGCLYIVLLRTTQGWMWCHHCCKGAAKVSHKNKDLPMQLVAANRADVQVVKALLEVFPEGASTSVWTAWAPLTP